MKSVKHDPTEFEQFDAGMKKLLNVPRGVYQKRLADLKEKPGTRGRKRKVKAPASPGPADPPQA